MLTVEIKRIDVYESNGDKEIRKYVSIDGKDDIDSRLSEKNKKLKLQDSNVIDQLMGYTFREVSQYFDQFIFEGHIPELEYQLTWYCYLSGVSLNKGAYILITFEYPELIEWNKPYSFKVFIQEIEFFFNKPENTHFKLRKDNRVFFCSSEAESVDVFIHNEYMKVSTFIQSLIKDVNHKLLPIQEGNSLISHFQFPDAIRNSCNQYLMYFSQFLADCGIAADTEIKEDINETLFKIIPRDKEESLEKIREALDIYLDLPSNPDFTTEASKNTDVAVMQLQSTVLDLQSKLLYAKSLYQMNQATIESLQLNNFQLKGMLETSDPKPKEDEESLIKGVVSVKKVDVPGFSFELPEILRKLKRKFGKK